MGETDHVLPGAQGGAPVVVHPLLAEREALERQIASQQWLIEKGFERLESLRESAETIIADVQRAIDVRDGLFLEIEERALWSVGGDFASMDEYMDAKGFSRQRQKQLRDRARLSELVNRVDAALPLPQDAHARLLSTLKDETQVIEVWSTASAQYGGNTPPVTRVRVLVEATREGVDVADADAIRLYEERQAADEIRRLFHKLSVETKGRLLDELRGLSAVA